MQQILQQILEEKLNRIIKEKEFKWDFEIKEDGIYGIEITASVKSWQQNFLKSFFKDDNLTVKIDNLEFSKKSISWNGNNLKRLKKTNFFIVKLKQGNHNLIFLANQSPKVETIRIYKIEENQEINFLPKDNYPIQEGDRRQWLTIILCSLGLNFLKIKASVKEGKSFLFFKKDDSDLKLIINGEIQKNEELKSHKNWYWCGKTSKGNLKIFEKELDLKPDLHCIEFWADRNPEVEEIKIKISLKIFGKIVLWQDIEKTDFVNLRKKPKIEGENILAQLKNNEEVEILEERVIGEWIIFKSFVWHKIRWQDKEGYILSSFIEIKGQERKIIIEKIKNKAKELKIDEDLVLALAGCESKYKPYATSTADLEESAKGIFQLTKLAIDQLFQNKQIYYYSIKDVFNIDQNIEGGIKYLKWLYETYYKNATQGLEKLIAVYNAGQKYFPPNEILDFSKIPTKEKQEEAKRLVNCVFENKKRKSWKVLFLSIFFFGILFIPFGVWCLDQNDFFESIVSEKEYLFSQISHFPGVILEKEKKQIIIFNSERKIVKKISTDRLDLNKIFEIPSDVREWNSIYFGSNVIEAPKNIFYFLATTNWSCGANNCGWILYKYDAKKDLLEVADKDILGSVTFYPSLDFKKLALISFYHGGYCNGKDYLEIINLDNFQKQEISKFHNDSFFAENISNFNWESSEIIKFKTKYYDCLNPNNNVEKNWIYDLRDQELYSRNR